MTGRLIRAWGLVALASPGCASVILDYPLRVHLVASAKSPDGTPMADVELRFSDGLSEKPIGVTGADRTTTVDHMFLWCVRQGDKNPPPPQFTLVLDKVGCKRYTTKHALARGGSGSEPPLVAVDAILECTEAVSNDNAPGR